MLFGIGVFIIFIGAFVDIVVVVAVGVDFIAVEVCGFVAAATLRGSTKGKFCGRTAVDVDFVDVIVFVVVALLFMFVAVFVFVFKATPT